MSACRTKEREACAVSVKGPYRPRRPRTSLLWRCLVAHFDLRFSDIYTSGRNRRRAVRHPAARSTNRAMTTRPPRQNQTIHPLPRRSRSSQITMAPIPHPFTTEPRNVACLSCRRGPEPARGRVPERKTSARNGLTWRCRAQECGHGFSMSCSGRKFGATPVVAPKQFLICYAEILTYFNSHPGNTHTFGPWNCSLQNFAFPDAGMFPSVDADMFYAFAGVDRFTVASYQLTMHDIGNFNWDVLKIEAEGSFYDLYDFDINAGGFSVPAAKVQSGYPTLGASGRVFQEDKVNFKGVWNSP